MALCFLCIILVGLDAVGTWGSPTRAQKLGGPLSPAYTLGLSLHTWVHWGFYPLIQLPSCLISIPSRHRAGEVLSFGLNETYISLSRALQLTNTLHSTPYPPAVYARRDDALNIQPPVNSSVEAHTRDLPRLISNADRKRSSLILETAHIADSALFHQRNTHRAIEFIQSDPFEGRSIPLRTCLFGTSLQEAKLQSLLKLQVDKLAGRVVPLDLLAEEVLQLHERILNVAQVIYNVSLEDQRRLSHVHSPVERWQWNWATKLWVSMLGRAVASYNIALASENTVRAQRTCDWAREELSKLRPVAMQVKDAQFHVKRLRQIIKEGGMVKWTMKERGSELARFLGGMEGGLKRLREALQARKELDRAKSRR